MMNRLFMASVIFVLTFAGVASITSAQNLPNSPNALIGTVSWTCHAFYLPARSIWKRTVDIEFDAEGVRSFMIDGVAAYSFNLEGGRILTAIDGERIQFDATEQTWASDLRGMVSSQGRCER